MSSAEAQDYEAVHLAIELAKVASRIEGLIEGIEEVPFTKRTDAILTRIQVYAYGSFDESVAAFHGAIHAYILAGYPELAPILAVEKNYRGFQHYVVLRNRPHEVAMRLPRALVGVDEAWAKQPAEAE